MIQLTEKDLKYIIKESINKIILNENMTDIVFHFTDFKSLEGILKTNEFHLSEQSVFKNNYTEKNPYYFCVTRQKYGDTGYSLQNEWCDVRITLNGRLFNQKYKTIPYDFFAKNSKMSSREIEMKNNNGTLPYKQLNVENEERLFSKSPIIPNASKYILRIDIYIFNEFDLMPYKDLIDRLGLSDKVYLYEDKDDFIIQNKNCISISDVPTLSEYISNNLKDKKSLEDIFDSVEYYSGFTKVELFDMFNFINQNGKLISNQWFDGCGIFNEGFSSIALYNKCNYINEEGKILYGNPDDISTWFDETYNFENGFGAVGLKDKYNFINQNGKLISNQWFDGCGIFNEGFATVELNDKYYYIDANGNLYDRNKNPIEL